MIIPSSAACGTAGGSSMMGLGLGGDLAYKAALLLTVVITGALLEPPVWLAVMVLFLECEGGGVCVKWAEFGVGGGNEEERSFLGTWYPIRLQWTSLTTNKCYFKV